MFAVFAALLSAGDMVFGDFVDGLIPSWHLTLSGTGTHVVWILLIGWASAGLLTYALQPDRRRVIADAEAGGPATAGADEGWFAAKLIAPGRSESRRWFGYVEAMVVLVPLTVLLALFVGFQFAYMFRGAAQIDVPGVTYAEYARAGFFQLLWVAVLVVAVVWLAICAAAGQSSGRRDLAFKIVCSLMIVLTGVILVSALKRLGLYEQAYGFTRLRLLSHVFTLWVAAVLALLLAQVHWTRRHLFLSGSIALAFVALFALNAINPDAYIARKDLDRAVAGRAGAETVTGKSEQLDYLSELSADAIPVIADRYRPKPGSLKDASRGFDHTLLSLLCAQTRSVPRSWREWNLGRRRADDAARDIYGLDRNECVYRARTFDD